MLAVVTRTDAQSANSSPDQSLITIQSIGNVRTNHVDSFGLGDRITMEVSGTSNAIQRATVDCKKLVLVLNDIALHGLCTNAFVISNASVFSNVDILTNLGKARLQFVLERKEANRAEWTSLLGSPRAMVSSVKLEIGVESTSGISVLSSNPFSTHLIVLPNEPFFSKYTDKWKIAVTTAIIALLLLIVWATQQEAAAMLLKAWVAWLTWMLLLIAIYCFAGPSWCWAAFFSLFLIGFIYLALHTEMLRDSGPKPPEGKHRPYSLARTQMAIWCFLIISSFVFIWLMTDALDTITGTVLALMGIGAGTALGAEAQEKGKANKVKVEKQELEAKIPRTPDEDCRLKRLQRITVDVPCLLAEKAKLEGDVLTKNKRLEEINGQLANEALAMLNQEKIAIESLGAARTILQNDRLGKIAMRLALGAEKERIVAGLAPGAPMPHRTREIDELLTRETEELFNREKNMLDALGETRNAAQNDRLANLVLRITLGTERAGLIAALSGPIPSRIKDIDAIIAARPLPISRGFFEDILTDDDIGISFHRFQMFVWTVVLGIIFIASVYRQLAMPEFNDTLLALMGISSGTYMGFMIAEPKK
jgi:hypothetical protein